MISKLFDLTENRPKLVMSSIGRPFQRYFDDVDIKNQHLQTYPSTDLTYNKNIKSFELCSFAEKIPDSCFSLSSVEYVAEHVYKC